MSQASMSGVSNGGAAYEPESMRLQREVDEFTHHLELEKSHLTILDEQIKQAKSELDERRQHVAALKAPELEDKQKKNKMKRTKNAIDTETLKMNMTKARNQQLRYEINVLRKELMSQRDECSRYEKKIYKKRSEAENNNKLYQQISKIAEETNNYIISLQAQHQQDKERFEKELQKLQLKLKERDEAVDPDDKKKDLKDTSIIDPKLGADFANPIVILRRRLNKIIETNREKKKLIEQFTKNVKVIQDAFDQIKTATGISNIQEIVTTFIKAEEQNNSLFNYVNMLNTEYDQLEESNREIREQIMKIENRGKMNLQEKQNLEMSLRDEVQMLKEEISRNINEADNTKKMFKKVQLSVQKMVDMFTKSKFFLCVAQKQNYEDGIAFSEHNIVIYLAELEEFLSSLITYVAFKRDEPNAAIASIPLEKLNQKDFAKKNIAIEPFFEVKVEPSEKDAVEDILSGKELYAKFFELYGQDKIKIDFVNQKNSNKFFAKDEDDVSN